MSAAITTVGELMSALAVHPSQTAIRLAVQPGYPQASLIGVVACSPDDADMTGRGDPAEWERVVWIAESAPLGYLPEIARDALGDVWAS